MKIKQLLLLLFILSFATSCHTTERADTEKGIEQTENEHQLRFRMQFVGNGKWVPILY